LAAAGGQLAHFAACKVFFRQVHALTKNDLTLFAACGRQTLRGFFEVLHIPPARVKIFPAGKLQFGLSKSNFIRRKAGRGEKQG